MKQAEITTKAAKCPKCGNFHLIASIEGFKDCKDTRKDFAEYAMEGFQILDVTTQEAKDRFGYCPKPKDLFNQ